MIRILGNVGPGHAIANESQQDFEEVPEYSLGGFTRLDFLGEGDVNQQDQTCRDEHKQSESGDDVRQERNFHVRRMGKHPLVAIHHVFESGSRE